MSASEMSTPITRRARDGRNDTALRRGSSPDSSVTSVGPAVPPAQASISSVARSMARSCSVGSTPRSKRCDASVTSP